MTTPQLNTTAIQNEIDSFKNAVGKNLFDFATGTIKGALENSGVDVGVKIPQPVASQVSQSSPSAGINWPMVAGGAAVLSGIYFFAKRPLKKMKAA